MKRITLKELNETYFADAHVCEIIDKEYAISELNGKTSCSWGSCIIADTGWALVSSNSPPHLGDKRTNFVCKSEFLEDYK